MLVSRSQETAGSLECPVGSAVANIVEMHTEALHSVVPTAALRCGWQTMVAALAKWVRVRCFFESWLLAKTWMEFELANLSSSRQVDLLVAGMLKTICSLKEIPVDSEPSLAASSPDVDRMNLKTKMPFCPMLLVVALDALSPDP